MEMHDSTPTNAARSPGHGAGPLPEKAYSDPALKPPALPSVISCISRSSARLGAADLAGDAALAHGDDAVADGQDLRQLRGDRQDGDAGAGQLVEQVVDLGLGARRRCRGSARRRSAPWAAAPASGPAPPSAGCRRRGCRPACSGLAMRMPSFLRKRSTSVALAAPPTKQAQALTSGPVLATERFVADRPATGTAPAACGPRAPGRCRRDRVDAASGSRPAWPSIRTRPRSIGSAPKMARASSVRPAPTSPARPRISPWRTCERRRRAASTACGSRASRPRAMPSTVERHLAGVASRPRWANRRSTSRPTIMADDAVDRRSRATAAAPTSAPSRRTVIAVADLASPPRADG